MELATYGAIISSIALALSGLSLWLHWHRHRQEQSNRQPEVTIESMDAPRDIPGRWRAIRLTVRNMDRYTLTVESIRIMWPLNARMARLDDAYQALDGVPWQTKPVAPSTTFRILPLNMRLPAAGTNSSVSGARYVHGDTHSVSLLVSSRPDSAHSLKVLIRQSSASTSFRVRNRIMTARMTALDEANSTKQAAEN